MKVCMISYSVYEYDNRVHRYGSSLVAAGHTVDVLCLGISRRGLMQYHGADVYRIQCRKMDEKGPLSYLLKLVSFFTKVFFKVSFLHVRKRYDVIHFHNIPDFGIYTTIVPKLMGARIVFDIHDLVPEFYSRKFGLNQDHFMIRFLRFCEKSACSYADRVITVTEIWKDKITARSVAAEKCTVILNAPYPALFNKSSVTSGEDSFFTILYHGALNEHFGVDIAIRAVAEVKEKIPGIRFNIYGRGREEENLRKLIRENGLQEHVIIHTPVSRDRIPALIAGSTIGVVPKRSAEFADEALSSKLLEFAYMRKPVIVSRTSASTHYFSENMVLFFQPENYHELAEKIFTLYTDADLRRSLSEAINQFNLKHHWDSYFTRYMNVLTG